MPRNADSLSDRATIAKLRMRVAKLEAQLAQMGPHIFRPDLAGWTLAQRLEGYDPCAREVEAQWAQLLSHVILLGWNRGILNRKKLTALLSEDYKHLASQLNLNDAICRDLGEDLFNSCGRDISAVFNGQNTPAPKM